MFLEELKTIAIPPTEKYGFDMPSPWNEITYPSDYIDLVNVYGRGEFQKDTESIVNIFNPFDRFYQSEVNHRHDILRTGERWLTPDFPYRVHPASPGLFTWGSSDSGKDFCWVTKGEPAKWPVVVIWDQEDIFFYEWTATEFLFKLLSGAEEFPFIGTCPEERRLNSSLIRFFPDPYHFSWKPTDE